MSKLIAVDWDGTCVENKWPGMGDWNPGAVETLRGWLPHFDITVFTVRIAPAEFGSVQTVDGTLIDIPRDPFHVQLEVDAIRQMLDDAGLHDVTIWQKTYKPPALCFIDDRGIHYNGRKGAWAALDTRVRVLAGLSLEGDSD